jgi:hypothetical protein
LLAVISGLDRPLSRNGRPWDLVSLFRGPGPRDRFSRRPERWRRPGIGCSMPFCATLLPPANLTRVWRAVHGPMPLQADNGQLPVSGGGREGHRQRTTDRQLAGHLPVCANLKLRPRRGWPAGLDGCFLQPSTSDDLQQAISAPVKLKPCRTPTAKAISSTRGLTTGMSSITGAAADPAAGPLRPL